VYAAPLRHVRSGSEVLSHEAIVIVTALRRAMILLRCR
jgi:hypothetical protein